MNDELVVIYAGGAVKTGMVRSLLESEGLTAFLRDENMGMTYPWALGAAARAR